MIRRDVRCGCVQRTWRSVPVTCRLWSVRTGRLSPRRRSSSVSRTSSLTSARRLLSSRMAAARSLAVFPNRTTSYQFYHTLANCTASSSTCSPRCSGQNLPSFINTRQKVIIIIFVHSCIHIFVWDDSVDKLQLLCIALNKVLSAELHTHSVCT